MCSKRTQPFHQLYVLHMNNNAAPTDAPRTDRQIKTELGFPYFIIKTNTHTPKQKYTQSKQQITVINGKKIGKHNF